MSQLKGNIKGKNKLNKYYEKKIQELRRDISKKKSFLINKQKLKDMK